MLTEVSAFALGDIVGNLKYKSVNLSSFYTEYSFLDGTNSQIINSHSLYPLPTTDSLSPFFHAHRQGQQPGAARHQHRSAFSFVNAFTFWISSVGAIVGALFIILVIYERCILREHVDEELEKVVAVAKIVNADGTIPLERLPPQRTLRLPNNLRNKSKGWPKII